MEDILKALVSSRQQDNSSQSADPLAGLIGGLLGGQTQPQSNNSQQSGGLGNMMGLLETVMGSGKSGSTANDPIMAMLNPFIAPLAKKANIPPEIAVIVVSFVAHKLLAHHPTSGRDSNSFNLDEMLGQIGSGKIDSGLLHSSGMVKEITAKTGLDEATAEKSLQAAFSLVGKGAAGALNKGSATPKPTAGKTLKDAGFKASSKIERK